MQGKSLSHCELMEDAGSSPLWSPALLQTQATALPPPDRPSPVLHTPTCHPPGVHEPLPPHTAPQSLLGCQPQVAGTVSVLLETQEHPAHRRHSNTCLENEWVHVSLLREWPSPYSGPEVTQKQL